MRFRRGAIGAVILAAVGTACLGPPRAAAQGSTPDYAALMAAPDRSDADLQADKRRDPVPFLAFAGLRPGMKVLDMGAGAGYSTELDARAVGPSGTVYGQNPPDFSERGKGAFAARLAKPAMQSSVSVLRPFDDPVPPDVHDLDVITFLFFYHDTTYMNVDRAEMDRKLFAALKPGGFLVIADHAAKAGADISVGKSLHRIDEAVVRREVEAAGFNLVAEGNFWRHPEDRQDFSSLVPTGPVDAFVLKFQKPM
ncbi:MAG TPA: methyltransferase [Xanthobacteraceae bacterium]|jgi:predicted methyltransferase